MRKYVSDPSAGCSLLCCTVSHASSGRFRTFVGSDGVQATGPTFCTSKGTHRVHVVVNSLIIGLLKTLKFLSECNLGYLPRTSDGSLRDVYMNCHMIRRRMGVMVIWQGV